jgi:uncharacterized DUF497 family protein
MEYEWDETKRKSNLAKHGLDFAKAWKVLERSDSITTGDTEHSQSELRYRTIGYFGKELCVVVVIHTKRKEKTRIISFRRAHKKERKKLWQSYPIPENN